MSRWSEYVRTKLHGTQKELADRSGINQATLSRWLKEDVPPSPDQVIKFARGLYESPVQALVMAEYISPEEAEMTIKDLALEEIHDIVLLDELKRRAVQRS
jgi:transcriptional regulator with XRE-family HTH domain